MNKEANMPFEVQKFGRVKSAGVPMDSLFFLAEEFKVRPTVSHAEHIIGQLANLRSAPPDEMRDRFFPRDRGNKSMFKSGSLMLRPILKTDQGPGRFLSFETSEDVDVVDHYRIDSEQGYCILEEFFNRQLIDKGYPKDVVRAIIGVQKTFYQGDMREAQLAYERLQIASEAHQIQYERQANVGRDAMFFIRPNLPKESIVLPDAIRQEISSRVQIGFADLIQQRRIRYAREHRLLNPNGPIYLPIYFQIDAQVFPDGSSIIEQIHLPDVGLFLTTLDSLGNGALFEVKRRVKPLHTAVIRAIAATANQYNLNHVTFITRPEVLENLEDTLEIKEILSLQEGLLSKGINVSTISINDIQRMRGMGIVMNINEYNPSFDELLRFHLEYPDLPIFPDPFLLQNRETLRFHNSVEMNDNDLEGLRSIVNIGNSYSQLMALDNYLSRLGFSDDVFHLYISSQSTPAPCFRFDPRGFQIALNYIKPGDKVELQAIPIDPSRSVLFEQHDRPLYNVFRFMAIKGDI